MAELCDGRFRSGVLLGSGGVDMDVGGAKGFLALLDALGWDGLAPHSCRAFSRGSSAITPNGKFKAGHDQITDFDLTVLAAGCSSNEAEMAWIYMWSDSVTVA
jgi:hypothetical protein